MESLGNKELTGGDCDAAGLGSYRVSLRWPPLHHKPQRHTAGGQQVQSLSPQICLQTACAEKLLKAVSSRGRRVSLSAQPISQLHHTRSSLPRFQVRSASSLNGWWGSPAQRFSDRLQPCLNMPASGGKSAQAHRGPCSLSGKQVRLRESGVGCKITLYSRSWG